jgi:hypothetical protein
MKRPLAGLTVALCTALALLAIAASATGAGAQKLSFDVDENFYAPFTSDLCGIEVWIRFEGRVVVTVISDKDGAVVRELDTQPGFTTTFYSPETGKSFRFPEAIVWHWEYPEGAYPGAPVQGMATGMHGRGGKVTDAGRVLFAGEVWDVVEIDGVPLPLIDFWPVGGSGRFADEVTYLAGRCEALGGTFDP